MKDSEADVIIKIKLSEDVDKDSYGYYIFELLNNTSEVKDITVTT